MQRCYQNESRFNGFYSNKDGGNVINLDEYKSTGTQLIANKLIGTHISMAVM